MVQIGIYFVVTVSRYLFVGEIEFFAVKVYMILKDFLWASKSMSGGERNREGRMGKRPFSHSSLPFLTAATFWNCTSLFRQKSFCAFQRMVQLEASLMDKGITLSSPRALLQVTESLSSFRPLIILNFISVCVCSKVLNWLNVILKEKEIDVKARSNAEN